MKGSILAIGIILLVIIGSFGSSATILQKDDCDCSNIIVKNVETDNDDFDYGLGLLVLPSEDPDLSDPIELPGNAPTSWDWRDVGGKNYVTPIRDQAECGSCYAFGIIAAMETIYSYQNNDPDPTLDLSEQFVVSCSQSIVWFNRGCCGGLMGETLAFLRNKGTPLESCFPYQAVDSKGRDAYDCPYGAPSNDPVKCSDRCPEWENQVMKLNNHHTLLTKESIKNAISTYGPVATGFKVYEDFKYYDGGIYEHETGGFSGNHLVAIIGYNDAQQYWICKNSWGPSWGENGFFRIKYGECGIDSPGACSYFESCTTSQVYSNPYVYQLYQRFPMLSNFFKDLMIL
jgi:C1A family cysteine protease